MFLPPTRNSFLLLAYMKAKAVSKNPYPIFRINLQAKFNVLGVDSLTFSLKEISKCRERAWDTVVTRKHSIDNILAGDQDGKDLIVSGNVTYRTTEGETFVMPFSGLTKIVSKPEVGQRLSLWHAYGGNVSRVD